MNSKGGHKSSPFFESDYSIKVHNSAPQKIEIFPVSPVIVKYKFKNGEVSLPIIHQARWLAKIGAAFYEFLCISEKLVNTILGLLKEPEKELYKNLKNKFLNVS